MVKYIHEKDRKNQLEEYGQVLRGESLKKFKEENKEEEFIKRMKQEIGSVYWVAVDQGFECWRILFYTVVILLKRSNLRLVGGN